MGAFGAGFLGAVGSAAHERAQRQHDLEMQQKKQELAYQQASLTAAMQRGGHYEPDPDNPGQQRWHEYTPQEYDNAHQQMLANATKVYGNSPVIKQIYGKAQQLVQAAKSHPLWGHPGADNTLPSQGGTNEQAQEMSASHPAVTSGLVPPPPGQQPTPPAPTAVASPDQSSASAAPPAQLDSKGAFDPSASTGGIIPPPPGATQAGSPNSAVSSAPQAPSDGKSASTAAATTIPTATDGGGGGTDDTTVTDQTAQAAPAAPDPSTVGNLDSKFAYDPSSVMSGQGSIPPPPSAPSSGVAAAPDPTAAAAAAPTATSPVPAPPTGKPLSAKDAAKAAASQKVAAGNTILNQYMSPLAMQQREAELTNQRELQQKQALFEQQQKQQLASVDNLRTALHREPTSTEIDLRLGLKPPAAMFTPHYGTGRALGANVVGGTMVDGSSPQRDHAGEILQQVGGTQTDPIFQVTNVKPIQHVIGGLLHNLDPITGQDLGAASEIPVKPGTTTSRVAPLTAVGPDGRVVQYAGSSTSTPMVIGAPLSGGQVPPPPTAGSSKSAAPIVTATDPTTGTRIPVPSGTAKKSQQPIVAAGAAASGGAPPEASGGGPKPARTLGEGVIPQGMYAQQQKRNTAINGAGQALVRFSAPQEDGSGSNLDIFKDPDAIKNIATYLNLNNAQIEGQFETAEKSGADGVAKFYLGIPQAFATASTKAVQDQYNNMTSREKRFVTDYYALLGQWGGMRAASGATGSKWNFLNLSQEIPNPTSITSYKEAVRKVKDNAAEIGQTAKSNTQATKYTEHDFLPQESPAPKPAKGGSKAVPPPPNKADLSGTLPPDVAATLQEGVQHTFGNGQTWTKKNGTAVRVK